MSIIDCHTHLEDDIIYDNFTEYCKIIKKYDVSKVITSSTKPKNWERSIETSNNFKKIYCSIGIHPWYVTKQNIKTLDYTEFPKSNSVVAIGEIGLDKRCNTDFDLQIEAFEKQLEISKQLNLPVVIHCVSAYNELINSLKRIDISQIGGIIHNYNSSSEITEELKKNNLKFSLNSILSKPLSPKKIEKIKNIGLDDILLETDISNMKTIMEIELHYKKIRENIILSEIFDKNKDYIENKIYKNTIETFNFNK